MDLRGPASVSQPAPIAKRGSMFDFSNPNWRPARTATVDRAEVRIGSVLADMLQPLTLAPVLWRIVDALCGVEDAELRPGVRL